MWDLVPPPGTEPVPPAVAVGHCTSRKYWKEFLKKAKAKGRQDGWAWEEPPQIGGLSFFLVAARNPHLGQDCWCHPVAPFQEQWVELYKCFFLNSRSISPVP